VAISDIISFGFGNGTFDPGVNKLPTLGYSILVVVVETAEVFHVLVGQETTAHILTGQETDSYVLTGD
jgi:hypothetical protein